MKKILITLLLFCTAAAGVSYFILNKPHKDVNREPSINVPAAQLFAEFTANEPVANAKYLNKALRVSGVISTIDQNQDHQQYIVLQTDDALSGIMCTMRNNDFSAKAGEQVSVKGFCSGFVGDVKLTDCVLSSEVQ